MAVLTVNTADRNGLAVAAADAALVAAAGGGDSFPNTGVEFVLIDNADAGDVTVTFDIRSTVDGQPVTDRTVVVSAGGRKLVGPFSTSIYNDANSRVNITYSGVTNLKVAALKMATT